MSAPTIPAPFTPANQPSPLSSDTVVETPLSPTPLPAFDSPEFASFFGNVDTPSSSGGLALFSGNAVGDIVCPPGIGAGPEQVSTPTPTRAGATLELGVTQISAPSLPAQLPAAAVKVPVAATSSAEPAVAPATITHPAPTTFPPLAREPAQINGMDPTGTQPAPPTLTGSTVGEGGRAISAASASVTEPVAR